MTHVTCLTVSAAILASVLGCTAALLTPKDYGDWENAGMNPFANTYAALVHEPVTSLAEGEDADEDGAIEGCWQRVDVAGKGVFDELSIPCETGIDLIKATDDKLVVGARYFSDTPNSLVVVSEDHTCSERTYDVSGEEIYVDSKSMSAEECRKIRKKMRAELTEIAHTSGNADAVETAVKNVEQVFSDLDEPNSKQDSMNNGKDEKIEGRGTKNTPANVDATTVSNDVNFDVERSQKATQRTEEVRASDTHLGNQLGKLGNQIGSQFGNMVSGILDVGSSIGSNILPNSNPSLLGGFLNSNQHHPHSQQKSQQHQQQDKQQQHKDQHQQDQQRREYYQHQNHNANRPIGIFNPLSEISNPLIQMFSSGWEDTKSSSIGQRGNSPTFGFANLEGYSTNRQSSFNNRQEADNQQGQFDLFGFLHPLARSTNQRY